MALLSPGIELNEIDRSQVANTAVGFAACYAAGFKQGPANTPTLISNEVELQNTFGAPDNDTVADYMTVKAFLLYGDSIYVNRAIDNTNNKKTEVNVTISSVTDAEIELTSTAGLSKGMNVSFDDNDTLYVIESIDAVANKITLDVAPENVVANKSKLYIRSGAVNAWCETPKEGFTNADVTTTSAGNKLVENDTDYSNNETSLPFTSSNSKLRFTARTAGTWGNKLKVAIVTPKDFEDNAQVTDGASVQDLFSYDCEGKQFGVVVLNGSNVVETYRVSWDREEKDDYGKTMYVEDVINRQSSYVFCKDNTSVNLAPASCLLDNMVKLKNGDNGEVGKKNIVEAFNVFSDTEQIEISYIIAHKDAINECISIAESRADCICFVNAPEDAVIGLKNDKILKNVLEARAGVKNSKYVGFFDNFTEMYNSSMDKYVYVPSSAHVAGMTAALDSAGSFSLSAAGVNNGLLTGVNRLAWSSNKALRDQMYRRDINSVINDVSSGIMVWGQKTTLGQDTAFNRLNVRRVFNYAERVVKNSVRIVLFQPNNEITRNMVVSMITPVFDNLKARQNIEDYRIICDESNNGPEIREQNKLVLNIIIKPMYVVEFITINFVCVNGSTNIDEVSGI